MAKLYYRGMADQNGRPQIGRSARLLGIRLEHDIDIEQMPIGFLDDQGYLLAESERESRGELVTVAIRNTKGMSVSVSIESLPPCRRPAKFGGFGKDPIWKIDDKNIRGDLEAVPDGPTHVSILPRVTMSLERYEKALANTRNDWERVD